MRPVTIGDEDDADVEVGEDRLGELPDRRVLHVVVTDGLAVAQQLASPGPRRS